MQTAQPPSGAMNWHLQETYKSLITISVECLKILAIVNGGAAVAVLTYVGNVVTRTSDHHLDIARAYIVSALIIICYCTGLFFTLVAFILAYCVQLQLFQEERARAEGTVPRLKHGWFLWTAIVLLLFSACLFFAGCVVAAIALSP